jgi:UDP-N-acetylmuramyl tripeptide synthase
MVTGTNGKTTTTRIIGQILKENEIEYITNKSGANLVGGVVTTFIDAVNLKGYSKASTALIEIDEAAFKAISSHLSPNILVVTNFFRDQLDRYGELYTTLKGVKAGIVKSKKTKLILNADDSLCASLGQNSENEVIFYGFNENAHPGIEEAANSDAMFCINCKTRYEYMNHVYGHLGGFSCPNCGYKRPDSQVTCSNVDELTVSYSDIRFSLNKINEQEDSVYSARVNLPGLYNIYNALAAVSCGYLLGLPVSNSIKALGSFECGFGRMETIEASGRFIRLILVKNPTGFNQVLNYLLTEDKNMQLAFLINDNLADGTDISWLWDVDFEKLEGSQHKMDNLYTAGIRAEDMAVRLKYAGIDASKISITKDYKELLETGLSRTAEGHNFYILPTYTAMLEMREVLKKRFGLKEFWK